MFRFSIALLSRDDDHADSSLITVWGLSCHQKDLFQCSDMWEICFYFFCCCAMLFSGEYTPPGSWSLRVARRICLISKKSFWGWGNFFLSSLKQDFGLFSVPGLNQPQDQGAIPENRDIKQMKFSFFCQRHTLSTSFDIFIVADRVTYFFAKTHGHAIIFNRKN